VRVAADQLLNDLLNRFGEQKVAVLAGNLRMQQDLQEQIAELLTQGGHVVRVERSEDLVGLLEEMRAQSGVRLFAVPWAAARCPQGRHDVLVGGH